MTSAGVRLGISDAMPADEPRMVTADGVLSMEEGEAAIVGKAGVVFGGGRILGVGEAGELRRKFGEVPTEHVSGIMMPGFVNAHTHLELTYMRGRLGPMRFPEWVTALMKAYPAAEEVERVIEAAVREGVKESLRFGVTSVGDISRRVGLSRRVLETMAIGGVSYGEVVGLGKMRGVADALLASAVVPMRSERMAAGISPHAPYTVEGPTLQKIVEGAPRGKSPVAMHLSEHAEEREFLRDLSGPLGNGWELMRNILDDEIPLMDGGPIRWAKMWGLLDLGWQVPVLLAHVNYCDAEEMELLAQSAVSVVYCPRTRAFFGHEKLGGHRYREMLAAGINVALGTDSLASNPDLSVLGEAAFLRERDGVDVQTLLEMITIRGARAMGIEADVGSLAAGKRADFIVLPVGAAAEVVERAPEPMGVWVGGRRV